MLKQEDITAIEGAADVPAEVVQKIVEVAASKLEAKETELKNHYTEEANKNANAIIDGAIKPIAELIGKPYDPASGVKQSEWIKNEVPAFIQSQTEGLNGKIADLEKQIKDGSGDTELKNQLEQLKTQRDQAVNGVSEWEQKYTQLEKESAAKLNGYFVNSALKSAMPRTKEDLSTFDREGRERAVLADIEKNYISEIQEDGSVTWKHKEKTYETVDISEVMKNHPALKDVLFEEHKQGGGGAGGGKPTKGMAALEGLQGLDLEAKKIELAKEAAEATGKGITSAEYKSAYENTMKELNGAAS